MVVVITRIEVLQPVAKELEGKGYSVEIRDDTFIVDFNKRIYIWRLRIFL